MKTRLIVLGFCLCFFLLAAAACGKQQEGLDHTNETKQEDMLSEEESNLHEEEKHIGETIAPSITMLASTALGDSEASVLERFGNPCEKISYEEFEGYYGEPWYILDYHEDLHFTIGEESRKVLRIDVMGGEYKTNLEAGIGDPAQNVLPLYRTFYAEMFSRHSDDLLHGWFLVEQNGLLIFVFPREEGDFAGPVLDETPVEGIILAYEHHFD